ncbi:hypothetical protein [Bauldia sp.]
MAYTTGRRHETRATLFSIGFIVVVFMAVYVLIVALF